MTDTLNTLAPIAAAVLVLGYVATCALWPYKTCRRCRGSGRLPGFLGWALCPDCHGGLQLRTGRRACNTYQRHRTARKSRYTNRNR